MVCPAPPDCPTAAIAGWKDSKGACDLRSPASTCASKSSRLRHSDYPPLEATEETAEPRWGIDSLQSSSPPSPGRQAALEAARVRSWAPGRGSSPRLSTSPWSSLPPLPPPSPSSSLQGVAQLASPSPGSSAIASSPALQGLVAEQRVLRELQDAVKRQAQKLVTDREELEVEKRDLATRKAFLVDAEMALKRERERLAAPSEIAEPLLSTATARRRKRRCCRPPWRCGFPWSTLLSIILHAFLQLSGCSLQRLPPAWWQQAAQWPQMTSFVASSLDAERQQQEDAISTAAPLEPICTCDAAPEIGDDRPAVRTAEQGARCTMLEKSGDSEALSAEPERWKEDPETMADSSNLSALADSFLWSDNGVSLFGSSALAVFMYTIVT
eukprot:TRINITY_DN9322_c0_g1_i1.p1 TRINITY_DN9322_c0_g1~~TRINITY_DN9322_c0_g1_i1.p1  ORF type:complete len:384 (-),score=63.33 TRINITY_DN9322_c0_g1_i1:149-1300(-)